MEAFTLDSQELFKVVVAGFILFCLYASSRRSDAARAKGLIVDSSTSGLILLETGTMHYKTKARYRKDAVLPLIALGNGLEQPAWGPRWVKVRNQLGLDKAQCLMPAVTSAGTFLDRPMTAAEGTLWLREILHVQGVPGNLELYSSHSLKATALSWTAKSCTMSYEERLTQGHHCSPKHGMALLYDTRACSHLFEVHSPHDTWYIVACGLKGCGCATNFASLRPLLICVRSLEQARAPKPFVLSPAAAWPCGLPLLCLGKF